MAASDETVIRPRPGGVVPAANRDGSAFVAPPATTAPDETVVSTHRALADVSGGTGPLLPRAPGRAKEHEPQSEGGVTAFPSFSTLAAHLRSGHFRSADLEVGARVHHYVITGVIGRGGMSRVFEARHVYLGQTVALKTTLEEASTESEFAERFLREAQTLATLGHPNVVRVLDANVWNEIPYVVTERLQGQTLGDALETNGPFSVSRILDVIEDVAVVLERQEDLGIVHRDIKPNNLYLRDDGTTCVFDYGLVGFTDARTHPLDTNEEPDATKKGELIGTPIYMAPEQFRGDGIGPWTDIYGLGMAVWHVLTGQPPRDALDIRTLGELAQSAPPQLRSLRPDAPEGVERLLSTMLAPLVADRYASARDLLRDLCNLRYRGRRIQGVTRGRVFVAMPFKAGFERVWNAIEDASIDARLRPTRIDRLVYIDNIWSQIVQEIANSAVVIADFSGDWLSRAPNVNVVTEAAHAVAIRKPVIVITQSPIESLPFDWRHVPAIPYSRSDKGLRELRRILTEQLEQVGRRPRPS